MKRLFALLPLVCAELAAASPVAIESDCEQTKLRRINDKVDGSNSDQQLERARPGPVSVFASIPSTDAQYAAVYGKTAGVVAAAKQGLATAIDRIRALDKNLIDVELGATDRKAFDRLTQRANGRVVLIVGHSVDGRFRFLNGSDMNVVDMAAACSAHDAFCVFLTCETDKLLAGSPCSAGANCLLSAEQTSRAVQNVASYAATAPSITAKALQDAIRTGARAERRALQARAMLTEGVVVGVIDTIYETSDSGPRKP
jgi:hypothetical protein